MRNEKSLGAGRVSESVNNDTERLYRKERHGREREKTERT